MVTRRDVALNMSLLTTAPDADERPLLIYFIETRQFALADLLITNGVLVDVNVTNEDGSTPLHLALMQSPLCPETETNKLISDLIRAGVEVDATRSYDNSTALHIALIWHAKVSTIQLLLDRGANINALNDNNKTPLLAAVSLENETYAFFNKGLYEPLASLKLLIEEGADLSVAESEYGFTFLHFIITVYNTAQPNHAEIKELVDLALQHGADLNAKSKMSETPLQYFVDLLSDQEGFFSETNTKSHLANCLSILQFLIDKGAEINSSDDDLNTPLHDAASKGRLPIVKLLLENGADLRLENIENQTALYAAEAGQHAETAEFLHANEFYTHWYIDDDVRQLLDYYLRAKVETGEIKIFYPANPNQNAGQLLADLINEQELQEALTISNDGVPPRIIVLPINLGFPSTNIHANTVVGTHWTLLLLQFVDGNRIAPTVYYFDSLGYPMPEVIAKTLKRTYENAEPIIQLTDKAIQQDGYNCGVWIVEAARCLVLEDEVLDERYALEIPSKRLEHQKLLQDINESQDQEKRKVTQFNDTDWVFYKPPFNKRPREQNDDKGSANKIPKTTEQAEISAPNTEMAEFLGAYECEDNKSLHSQQTPAVATTNQNEINWVFYKPPFNKRPREQNDDKGSANKIPKTTEQAEISAPNTEMAEFLGAYECEDNKSLHSQQTPAVATTNQNEINWVFYKPLFNKRPREQNDGKGSTNKTPKTTEQAEISAPGKSG